MNYNFELLFGCFTASLMKKKESIHVNCLFNGMLQTMKLGLTMDFLIDGQISSFCPGQSEAEG